MDIAAGDTISTIETKKTIAKTVVLANLNLCKVKQLFARRQPMEIAMPKKPCGRVGCGERFGLKL